MKKIQKILIALVIASLVAAGAGSVYLERNVFHIQNEHGKKRSEPITITQPLYRLKIENSKEVNIVLQERVELITVENSDKVGIVAKKGYGSKEEINSKKVTIYDASTGEFSCSAEDHAGVVRIDKGKSIFQTISSELLFLEITNSKKVTLTLKEYVDVIKIQKSEDIRIVAQKGYGYKQIIDSKKVEIEGTALSDGDMNVVIDASFSDAGYHAVAIVSSGQITYQEETTQDTEAHGKGHKKYSIQSDSGLVQDTTWYAGGSFNSSREVTVWNEAVVDIGSFLQTGDWQNQGGLQAIGSGSTEQGVASDNYIYGSSHVAITPAP